jgi:alpha-1,6-mannosyltransferase
VPEPATTVERLRKSYGSLIDHETRPILGLAAASVLLSIAVMIIQVAINTDGASWWRAPGNPSAVAAEVIAYLAATAGVIAIYVVVVVRCLRGPVGPSGRAILMATPVILSVCLLFVAPTFSFDVLSYIAHGATGTLVAGGDAYSTQPSEVLFLPLGQELRDLGWVPPPGTSPYGPLWTLMETGIVRLPLSVAGDILLFKLIEMAATLCSAAVIWRILALVRPNAQLAGTVAFLWNPVVLVELVGEGHNDGLMILFVLLGLYATLRAWPSGGIAAGALGVLVKFLPALFIPAQLVYLWRTRIDWTDLVRGVALGAAISVALAVVLFAPFWSSQTLSGLSRSGGGGPWPLWPTIGGVLYSAIQGALPAVDAASAKTILLGALFASYLVFQSLRVRDSESLVQAMANIALIYMLVVSAVYWPWYSVLPIALFVLTPLRRSLVIVVVLSAGSRAIGPLAAGLRPEVGPLADWWAVCTLGVILLVLVTFAVQSNGAIWSLLGRNAGSSPQSRGSS